MKFGVSVKVTGQSREIAGFKTREVQMTIKMETEDAKSGQKGAMNVLSDMWMAPDVPGYQEVKAFHRKMAEKLAWTPGTNFASMMQPGAGQGMAEAYKEMAKMNGVPVLTIMRMGGDGQAMPQPGDAEKQAAQQQQSQENKPSASESAGSAIASKLPGLGRFGGFGRKKKQPEPEPQQPPAQQQQQQQPGASGSLMEITTESAGFSSAPADPSKLDVPAGFKKVDSDFAKRHR